MRLFLLVAVGAAAGSAIRFLVARRLDGSWPTGTLLVNVVGSALLGVFSALALTGGLGVQGLALLGTGFCGGLTTFSTFVVQSVDASSGTGPRSRGPSYVVVTLALSLLACWAGFALVA